ncbi:MAG TPA: alpha/beta hydrolase [Acidimicrobiales bacterium]|nr:alpha/beta hydrolase [Acidimicrobiales bacterium]
MTAAASTVTIAGELTLSYAEQGHASDLPVLLLPGPTDSWRSYRGTLDHLPSSVRAVALSQRGHGDSDKPETGYRVEDFATDVLAFLDALAIERVVLVAHSGSCLVARRVALERPDRVAGLVLEASPSTLRDDAGLRRFVDSVVSTLADPVGRDVARSFAAGTSSGTVADDTLEGIVDEVVKVPVRVWRETFADLLQYDDLSELGRIDAPTLLVWGDADGLVGRDAQEQLLDGLGDARLMVYAGVGHTPRWEDPPRFASDVADFVEWLRQGRP